LEFVLWGMFERGNGNFLIILGEGIGIQVAIMRDSPIKEPWSFEKDMASIYVNNITQ